MPKKRDVTARKVEDDRSASPASLPLSGACGVAVEVVAAEVIVVNPLLLEPPLPGDCCEEPEDEVGVEWF